MVSLRARFTPLPNPAFPSDYADLHGESRGGDGLMAMTGHGRSGGGDGLTAMTGHGKSGGGDGLSKGRRR